MVFTAESLKGQGNTVLNKINLRCSNYPLLIIARGVNCEEEVANVILLVLKSLHLKRLVNLFIQSSSSCFTAYSLPRMVIPSPSVGLWMTCECLEDL